MLYIEKGPVPAKIKRQVNEIVNGNTADSIKWRSLPDEAPEESEETQEERAEYTAFLRSQFNTLDKTVIRDSLLREQRGICAYCMRRIKASSDTPIEHWYPLSNRKATALDYRNFLLSCNGINYAGTSKISCCDEQKGDIRITIDPRNQNMMSMIAYENGGRVYVQGTKAECEILQHDLDDTLNLNDEHGALKQERSAVYRGCVDEIKRLAKRKQLTVANVRRLLNQLEQAEMYDTDYVGVAIFYYRRWLRNHA